METSRVAFSKRALNDEPHCGDLGAWWEHDGRTVLCIADGLGHGEHAQRAAEAAIGYVTHHLCDSLQDIFRGCDSAIRRTRGVVMGLGVIDNSRATLTYAGIGNTRAVITGARTVHLVGNNGIVGGGFKFLCPETVSLEAGDLVIFSTDGIKEMIDLLGYNVAGQDDLQQLAERILHDWNYGTDDAAVLIFRHEAPQ